MLKIQFRQSNSRVSMKAFSNTKMFCRKPKLDPELDTVSGELLDSSAARHKLSVKPRRTHTSSRHSPTRLNLEARYGNSLSKLMVLIATKTIFQMVGT